MLPVSHQGGCAPSGPCPHPGLASGSSCRRPALVPDGSSGVSRIPPPAGGLAGLREEELGKAPLPWVWGRGSCDSPQGSRTGREGGFPWGNQSPEMQQLPPSPQGYDFLAQDGPGPHFTERCLLTKSLRYFGGPTVRQVFLSRKQCLPLRPCVGAVVSRPGGQC